MNATEFIGLAENNAQQSVNFQTVSARLLAFCLIALLCVPSGYAQMVRLHSDQQSHGIIGREQAFRIPGGVGYYQPIEVRAKNGVKISVLDQVEFTRPTERLIAAMQMGSTYRLKVTNIPDHPGLELFPSIEVVNRLYPPDQMRTQFPVVVELNLDDLASAADGAFIVKVVYLEDPSVGSVQKHDGVNQPQYDVASYNDVLDAADMLGRPMAIVRMGSRIPLEGSQEMLLDSAPVQLIPATEEMGQPAQVFNLNQKYADQDPSYVPQMSRPREGYEDLWNQEHIFDGGDRAAEAAVGYGDDWTVSGVESEDTIAHFDTLDGKRLVVPSNRVAIYSPRFAAVRKRIHLVSGNQILPVVTGANTDVAHLADSRAKAGTTTQQNQAVMARKADLAQAMRQQDRVAWANGTVKVITATGGIGAYENTSLMRHGKLDGSEKAWLAKGQVAAATWGGSEGVKAIANFQEVNIVYDVVSADEIVESHSPNNRPKLRVIKVASKDAAQPGETVEFTIRFDNLGDQTIGNVTLMDNLSDRLEFVEGSAKCDRKCKFYTQLNDRGSKLLRWDVEAPMKVTEGGVITFQCLVK